MNELSSNPKPGLAPGKPDSTLLPTPFVAAGIGLIAAMAFSGGLSGGQGFLIGLAIGLILSVVVPLLSSAKEQKFSKCPHCGALLEGCCNAIPEKSEETQTRSAHHG